ncbi:adenylate/guanylate cyclase domain-containing protein [Olleya sp. YS]|uniref:adenylate/guanylate cyclase domain-containing protein n=1 Tax=Olleya sp. YS TaxID=3028318 RepID=UPI0024341008|nr:adenylate/guanylate cyclase domain-containing protein [Olleya sp. YS]WGD34118.1 adenylate/guanylate cyclase domain-containing protein [Olleya sp. YS]
MKNTLFQFLRLLFATIIFWSLAFCLFIMIRYYQVGAEGGKAFATSDSEVVPILQWLEFGVFAGIIVGIVYAIVEFIFEKFQLNKLATGLVLLEKSLIYLLMLILSTNYIVGLIEQQIDRNLPNENGWWKENKVFWLVVGYFIICSLIFSFLKISKEKFGKGVLFNQLIGKYKKPREEKRIFMFLDLQGSTTIAEQLGHYKYSELIQECFYDLNRVITNYNAEIYQYVGDEAVISWTFNKGIKNNNCVELFFKFQDRLLKKQKAYQKHFGLQPKFKAGLHGGNLIVTEVGTLKKEIAYHGDVINTSARIQGECNKYNETLLISKQLLEKLQLNKYKIQSIGNISLKGKEEEVRLYSINKS